MEYEDKTSLMLACKYNNDSMVDHILANHPSNINIQNKKGKTAIHYSCQTGNLMNIQCLMDSGAALDIPTHDGRTPIFMAIERRHYQIVKFILGFTNFVTLNKLTSSGFSAMQLARWIFSTAKIRGLWFRRGKRAKGKGKRRASVITTGIGVDKAKERELALLQLIEQRYSQQEERFHAEQQINRGDTRPVELILLEWKITGRKINRRKKIQTYDYDLRGDPRYLVKYNGGRRMSLPFDHFGSKRGRDKHWRLNKNILPSKQETIINRIMVRPIGMYAYIYIYI